MSLSSSNIDNDKIHQQVSQYYGQTVLTTSDLQTNACCTNTKPPPHIQQAISKIHPTIVSKYYGCGLCIPKDDLTGLKILDLGCGAGRDVYILSQLVGPTGQVHGVDMTVDQLNVAREYQTFHQNLFEYPKNNVFFHLGYLEQLHELQEDLQESSFDIIVSNCVINLCTNKEAIFQSCFSLLKSGGELYFSDVYASRRIPQSLTLDPILYGECLSGALYWNDFLTLAKQCGFKDPRLVEDHEITIQNINLQEKLNLSGHGNIQFYSATYRLFKLLPLDKLDTSCEDYGQAVIYKGTIGNGNQSSWSLDNHHTMEMGKVFPVCGNTFNMLFETRFRPHFEFIGNFSKHYGIFDGCGTSIPFSSAKQQGGGGSDACGGGPCC